MTRIKAALNGGRPRPAPITPQEIAADARAAIAAGAFAIHVHPRDRSGRETLDDEHLRAVVRAAGEIGVTTGAWIAPNRLDLIRAWTELPAFASVNMVEEQAIEVAELLLSRGVAVEPGLSDPSSARVMMESRIWRRCLRVLIEPQEQKIDDALENVSAIEELIADCDLPRVLHGVDATAWPLLEEAARRGFDARIGFEDTLVLPDGRPAVSNVQLIAAARAVVARVTRN